MHRDAAIHAHATHGIFFTAYSILPQNKKRVFEVMADWIPKPHNHLPQSIQKIKLFIVLCCGKPFALSDLVCDFSDLSSGKKQTTDVSHTCLSRDSWQNHEKKLLAESNEA